MEEKEKLNEKNILNEINQYARCVVCIYQGS